MEGWQASFFDAIARTSVDRIAFAAAELAFYFACMAIYVWLERGAPRFPKLATALALLAATDLLYHFPPLFSILNLLADRPELATTELTSRTYRHLLFDWEVMSMVAHVCVASVAVTAVAVMCLAARATSRGANRAPSDQITALAARWALGTTLLEFPVGIWLLLSVNSGSRESLLGADLLSSLLFATAIVAAFGLLHHLLAIALGDTRQSQIQRAALLVVGIVLLMSAAQVRSRTAQRQAAIAVLGQR